MATDPGAVDFLLDQLSGAGAVSARRMFGEYGIWLDGRMSALVCDGRLYLRDLPPIRALLADPVCAPPFPGARDHLLIEAELDDPELLVRLLRLARAAAPEPKPRRKR